MRSTLLSLPIAALGALLAPASAQSPATPPSPPQIVTTASGEATVVPDRATIILTVETRASTAAAAGADNANRQRAVLDALRAAGIASEDLTTLGYSVTPEMRYDGREPRVTGYVARNAVRVKVNRIEQVGPIIDTGIAKGANSVSSLRYFSSRTEELRRTALAAAVAKARADAEAMARAAGGTVGALLELQSVGDVVVPLQERAVMMTSARMDAAQAETPINPGEQVVTATVQTRWLFVAGSR